jgi:DNA-directed RNA polymerase beta' subunit
MGNLRVKGTLHSGSMMAKEIIIRPGKTIRMNLSCTKSFNADKIVGNRGA